MRRILLVIASLIVVTGLAIIVGVFAGWESGAATTTAWVPPTASPQSSASAAAVTPSASASVSAAPVRYAFPVLGRASYARDHHDYPASDIMAACGLTVVSPVDGVVLEVNRVDTWNSKINAGATRGGLSWSILGNDGARYYGSHMSVVNADVKAGAKVAAGHPIGKIGRTGDAGACHLHFGISPVCKRTGDWWIRRGVIWPWSFLDAWRKGQAKSPFSTVAAWQREHGCPTKPLVDP